MTITDLDFEVSIIFLMISMQLIYYPYHTQISQIHDYIFLIIKIFI